MRSDVDRNVVMRRIPVLQIHLTLIDLDLSPSNIFYIPHCILLQFIIQLYRPRGRILSVRSRSFVSRGPRASWHGAWGGQMTQHWYLDWKNKVAGMVSG